MTAEQKMQIVLGLAQDALLRGELPIAAAVFLGDEIISSASTTEQEDGRFLVHAELNALIEADKQALPFNVRKELELFVNLEPCMMCFGAAMGSFVGSIVYSLSAPDGAVSFAKELVTAKSYDKISSFYMPCVASGILAEETKALWRQYIELYPEAPLISYAKSLIEG